MYQQIAESYELQLNEDQAIQNYELSISMFELSKFRSFDIQKIQQKIAQICSVNFESQEKIQKSISYYEKIAYD